MTQENTPSENFKLDFDNDAVQESLKKVKHWSDLTKEGGPFQLMFKNTIEAMMKGELEDHLGYSSGDVRTKVQKKVKNYRNGSYKKTLATSVGGVEIDVPRDRMGEYEPKVVPKFESRSNDLEQQIMSLYAKGLSTRDISDHLKMAYFGVEISPTIISNVTNKILDNVTAWQSRPLENTYAVVFFDAIFFKVRKDHRIVNMACYICFGLNNEGFSDVLGLYCAENESASYWLSVATDLKNRGVEDILICCMDGLKGLPDAIKVVYPKTEIQLCIIHQIRNSMKFIASKDKKEFLTDLKLIYKAPTLESAELGLKEIEKKWGAKHLTVVKSWQSNWENLTSYFAYTPTIRKIIYTTNIIESLNRQIRKATKARTQFPDEKSFMKCVYLVIMDLSKKWTRSRHNWPEMAAELSIRFGDRFKMM